MEYIYSKKKNIYLHTKALGNNLNEAFIKLKNYIYNLIQEGGEATPVLEKIARIPISPMFKGKILYVYYPDKFLNIFSETDVDYFLRKLNLDTTELMKKDVVFKREELLKFKNSDVDMKKWSINMFSTFLYLYYPKGPRNNNDYSVNQAEPDTDFPSIKDCDIVDPVIQNTPITKSGKKSSTPIKIDYENQAREWKKLGDRGEFIVMEYEKVRFKDKNLDVNKLKWKSQEDDSCGYDILSLNDDGTKRYIEVKATQSQYGNMEFYFTENERLTALEKNDKYYLYIVYEVHTEHPTISIHQNPFVGNNILTLNPIKYKVKLNEKVNKKDSKSF